MNMHTVLFPTDFSEASRRAFSAACALARDHGARLVVLHVVPSGTYEFASIATLGQLENSEQFTEDMRHNLQHLQPPVGGPPVQYKVATGDPATVIVEAAKDMGCDMIVLATHGRTGLRRLLMGSVAEQVMRRAPCPVMLAKDFAALARRDKLQPA